MSAVPEKPLQTRRAGFHQYYRNAALLLRTHFAKKFLSQWRRFETDRRL